MQDPADPARVPYRRTTGALWVSFLLLVVTLSTPGASSPGPLDRSAPVLTVVGASSGMPCPGVRAPSQYHGNVTDDGGGASAPPVSNQSVVLSYRYTQTFHPQSGGPAQYLCVPTSAQTLSGSGGRFSVNATLATPFCNKPYGCWNYSGPYGPVSLDLGSGALPPGYYLNVSASQGSYTIARVLALERVALAPSGFTTLSLDAPTVVRASPLSGQGTESPANLSFAWSVSGTGWQVLSGENASAVTVEPVSTSNVATAEVWVNGSYGGALLHAPPVSVLLTAAATSIQTGAVQPTSVDQGVPATFHWTGTGAEGYAYTAGLEPGLTLPRVEATCANRSISGGLLEFDCSVPYTYSTTGVAQPSATLSNGYSSANYTFASVTVSSGLVLNVAPTPAVEYQGVPVDFTVAIPSGSGTSPFGPACLADGIGDTSCQSTPGPSWRFSVTYPTLGQYQAVVTVADSGGANSTTRVPVTIVERPSLEAIALPQGEFPQGGRVSASDEVFGGALPLAYWWNTTTSSNVGGGRLESDGPVSISFPAGTSPGDSNLTLTVVDGLGTVVRATAPYYVVATTAVAIDLLRPPYASISAGSPLSLTFEAVDVLQGPAVGFSAGFSLVANSAGLGLVWVNDSTHGPVLPSVGVYPLPPSDWSSGYLNLTLAESAVGVFNVTFSAPAGVTGPPALRLTVGPDQGAELLVHPDTVRSGARTNATLYEIQDCFGNPVSSGTVRVESDFGPLRTNVDSPIRPSNGAAYVWVNFTAVGDEAGVVYVWSTAGGGLLLRILVPAPAAAPADLTALAVLGAVSAAAVVGGAVLIRRRRPDPAGPPVAESEAEVEDGLKRLAEGRAHVLARVPFGTPVDLDHIALGWTGPPPDAAELAEWVGSLVAEGALRASIGPEGRPRFVRVEEPLSAAPPRIEVDAMALDAALERLRLESHATEDPGDPPDPDDRDPATH